ncbi:MAG: tetratricopeptide repeat protein [Pseudomonadota bacterium]
MMIRALTRTLWSKPAFAALVMAPALLVTTPAPALAQDSVSEARLRKLEAEIRALQRNVFPGGDERFFEPQIRPDEAQATSNTSGPSTTAVTDILARLDAIEVQLQRLTGVTEENGNTIATLTERVAELEAANEAATVVAEAAEEATEEPNAMDTNLAAMGAAQGTPEPSNAPVSDLPDLVPTAPATEAAVTGPTAERLAAVQAITKPQTEDPADDEYSYGFRLWNAGFYPEARQQLASFVESYPDHWRATYGRNLLGRAYLDDGMTEEAARWFLRNYQTDRTAPRAADSLLFLADAMIQRDDTNRACIALAEFGETYPALATGRLLERYQSMRNRVTCEG